MGGHARGPTGLAAPRAWGAPQSRSSPRAGRQMGQVGLGQGTGWSLPHVLCPHPGSCQCLWSRPSCVSRTCALTAFPADRPALPGWARRCFAPCPCCVPVIWHLSPACAATHPVLPVHSGGRHSGIHPGRQGALVRGHSFQSAGEETEARGGAAPHPRPQSELVSAPAQGPACLPPPPSFPRPCPSPAASSPCPVHLYPATPPRARPPPCPALMPPCLCLLQGPLHRHPCAGPKAPSACGTRRWQAHSGGSSAPGSRWGRSSESFSPGDTPRQRFRRRPLGPLGSLGKGEGPGSRLISPQLPGEGGCPPCVPPQACPPLSWPLWLSSCLAPPQVLEWDGMAPSRPWRNTKQMPAERVSGVPALRVALATILRPLTRWTASLY